MWGSGRIRYDNVYDNVYIYDYDDDEEDEDEDDNVADDDVEDDDVEDDKVHDDDVEYDDVEEEDVEQDEDEDDNAEDEVEDNKVEDDDVDKEVDEDVEDGNGEEDDEKDDNVDVAEDEVEMMMLRWGTDPKTGTHTLCEPARSKCTWTVHKGHFMLKFAGKMAQPRWSTLIKRRPFTLTVRAPQCGHTVWGKSGIAIPKRI